MVGVGTGVGAADVLLVTGEMSLWDSLDDASDVVTKL